MMKRAVAWGPSLVFCRKYEAGKTRIRSHKFQDAKLCRKVLGYDADVLYPRTIGTLRSDDGDGNGNATKAIGLISKTTILHVHQAFLCISLPSLHDYEMKMPNFTMFRGSTQATTKFPLSF